MGAGCPAYELGDGVLRVEHREVEDLGGQDPLGQVVADLELGGAAGDRQLADLVEEVEGLARLGPVPAPVLLRARPAGADDLLELTRRDRPGLRRDGHPDPLDHRVLDVLPPLAAGGAVEVHPVLHERPQVDGHERLDVRPVLHHPPRPLLCGPRQQAGARVGVVGTHPGVERHVVRPLEHVDRVDLQHPGARQGAVEGPHRRPGVRLVEEALGGQRDPTGLGTAQRLGLSLGRRHGPNSTTPHRHLDCSRLVEVRAQPPVVEVRGASATSRETLGPGAGHGARSPCGEGV